jgi:hypothetical protein
VVPGQGLSATVLGAPMSAFGRVAATRPDTGQPPTAEPVAVPRAGPRVGPGPVAPPLAPVAWPIVPLNAGLLPAEPVVRAARSPAAVPPHVLADVALPSDEPPPEEPAPGAPGNISRPIRAAAAMAGVLLVGAALAAAAGSGHTTPAPPSAPRMAVFHSSDHDMDRFWHAG